MADMFIPQVALPKTTTFLADRVIIENNWDDKLAVITDSDAVGMTADAIMGTANAFPVALLKTHSLGRSRT